MEQQECIPVGCIPPAAVASLGGLVSTAPPEQAPPGADPPGAGTPPGVGTPLKQASPGAGTPSVDRQTPVKT